MAFNDPACEYGFSCLLKGINNVGLGFPFLVIFVLTWIILTTAYMHYNNHFIKSFTASTFVMVLIAIIYGQHLLFPAAHGAGQLRQPVF
jgi:multisubunit Na+/H+ antiporter MnhB subunit